ncbi:Zn-ribbon domain-containing OB-fold protein [Microbacterium ulmi]|uniref:DNA-binding protein n=1 Tax=Microbacterium ulmi TaxID=179095 RepID=A0A7Y2M021_9MICO|nr:zinc ribbon domain-containing protein [Microbacterium ulmi]NII69377.1 hypothetical protein [Microbacterium ulmi]NNH04011.1 hypothetical protein [Microbacterium ulmi]
MNDFERPNVAALLPPVDEISKPFWEGLGNGVLRVQSCRGCEHVQFPPSPVCEACLSRDVEWITASGRARLWSKVRFWKAYLPQYDTPYSVVLAKLEEGPLVTARISEIDAEGACFDAPLRATFPRTADGTPLLGFVPDDQEGTAE